MCAKKTSTRSFFSRSSLPPRYLELVPVKIVVRLGGTNSPRLCVMNVECTNKIDESLLVVDDRGDVKFGSWDFAALLGWVSGPGILP